MKKVAMSTGERKIAIKALFRYLRRWTREMAIMSAASSANYKDLSTIADDIDLAVSALAVLYKAESSPEVIG